MTEKTKGSSLLQYNRNLASITESILQPRAGWRGGVEGGERVWKVEGGFGRWRVGM